MAESQYSPNEIMTVAAARKLANGTVCFVGIGLPSAAANLARITHAPDAVLIYESGTIGAKPDVLPLSIGDGELAETADTVVSVPEIFRYWLQAGRVDVGFLGAAQIDKFGNINTTVIGGTYEAPRVRLPGAGGAPEIATAAKEIAIILRHSKRTFVETLDFVTSSGYYDRAVTAGTRGPRGRGPTTVITDLGILVSDRDARELVLTTLHLGVTVDQVKAATGWELKVAPKIAITWRPVASNCPLCGICTRAPRLLTAAWPPLSNARGGARHHAIGAIQENASMASIAGYRRPFLGTQPDHLHPQYRSSIKRAPSKPLVYLPHTLSEVTGPSFGTDVVDVKACDLTKQHSAQPIGERIIVSGRVIDEDGRPVPKTLIEIWQANSAGRYLHKRDQHDAPLDPNFSGNGYTLTDSEGRYRFITIKPGEYPWRNHVNAWRPAHIHFSISVPRLLRDSSRRCISPAIL